MRVLSVEWCTFSLVARVCCVNFPVRGWQWIEDRVVRLNASEEASTGNGESETSAGTHPQTRTYQERTGLYWILA